MLKLCVECESENIVFNKDEKMWECLDCGYKAIEPLIIKQAKDIETCDDCPIYGEVCPGGAKASPSGAPIDPPCVGWDDEQQVTEDMYDCDGRDY